MLIKYTYLMRKIQVNRFIEWFADVDAWINIW